MTKYISVYIYIRNFIVKFYLNKSFYEERFSNGKDALIVTATTSINIKFYQENNVIVVKLACEHLQIIQKQFDQVLYYLLAIT